MLLKNRLTDKDKMTSSNINIYVSKCYLKIFKIVPSRMGGFNILAKAIGNVNGVLIKKIKLTTCFHLHIVQ